MKLFNLFERKGEYKMGMFHHHSRGGKRLQRKPKSEHNSGVRLAALLLCLSMLTGFLPAMARAADGEPLLSGIVKFDSITLNYPGADGQSEGEEVPENALLGKDAALILSYTYEISEEQCKQITAGTKYYLEVSPHLVLPNLSNGSALTIETEEGLVEFGKIYADGKNAWVTFNAKEEGSTETVLSEYGGLDEAHLYLHCKRADDIPADATEEEKKNNLYAMKFENNTQLNFGYAENEPVTAKAKIDKGGSLTGKTITWTIDYTPWQNPAEVDGITLDTPFELRDTIDTSLHSYVDGSVTIDGQTVTAYTSRDDIQGDEAAYVIVETSEDDGNTTLTFGGTKFNAGQATQGNPATSLKITYQTTINDNLLLPGGKGGKKVTNTAELFAGPDFENQLGISGKAEVTVDQPTWLTKEGKTTRNPGNGATTDWTITFQPNGFTFDANNGLTLHDKLPQGSTPVKDSLYVNGEQKHVTIGDDNSFTFSPIVSDGTAPVTIKYQTYVPEEMYDSGTSLGSNIAYFTFNYDSAPYTTPQVKTPIDSGDGSGTPGTATLVKTNNGYNANDRTIAWTVTINPHRANLQSGTFTDDLSAVGPQTCTVDEHSHGLELVGGKDGITASVDGTSPADPNLVTLEYKNQQITIKIGNVGTKIITLTYTTEVCDPCIFANNTAKTAFINTISTNDMIIGASATEGRSTSVNSTATVSATVLTKIAPVYDYASGTMKWTVEVDAAGLPMADVVLTDDLPAGLTYVNDSFKTTPDIAGASASVSGQTLTIDLGTVNRPLAKLNEAVKIAYARDKGKAKSKTFSTVTVALGKDPKSFDKTDSVFDENAIS